MHIKLNFLGATQNVTGSRYLVEANDVRFLVDCGFYQERDYRYRNWDPFHVPPDTLDAVLLTHAHLDHCGLLPKLVREGFHGRVFCTDATADIVKIMLMDSARIQEEDAAYKKKRHKRSRRKGSHPEVPLYTTEDAKACFPLLSPVRYGESVLIGNDISATFNDAGHVLGSSMILVRVNQDGETRSILFSGDVGRWNKPILRDPTLFEEADYVLVESTYGDRLHEDSETIENQLADAINSTVEGRGNILVPSFALERSQEVLYYLNTLLMERRIPRLLVFLDSPMAVGITDVFNEHPELYDSDMMELTRQGSSPFDYHGLTMVRTVAQSKAINNVFGSTMIIAGSGMCTGGRIKHHLVTNISRPECTVLFVGYQAAGTLGRIIVDGVKKVRLMGKWYPVRARVSQINGFSAHADRDELFRWLSSLKRPPKHIFVVHGEPDAAKKFADYIVSKTGWNTSVPEYGQESILD
jgi:metallo-beta-lactamase family protein